MNEKPTPVAEDIKVSDALIAELKLRFPEQFAGTPEWQLKVRLEAAAKVYDETGLIMWV